jgi:hypothetical protein
MNNSFTVFVLVKWTADGNACQVLGTYRESAMAITEFINHVVGTNLNAKDIISKYKVYLENFYTIKPDSCYRITPMLVNGQPHRSYEYRPTVYETDGKIMMSHYTNGQTVVEEAKILSLDGFNRRW